MSSSSLSVSELRFENGTFSPSFKPPGSANSLFLGGAGLRGMEMGGKFTKFTTIAVYLEETAVALLADKWRRMTAVELTESVEFFTDIITGPFEKLLLFSLILPLKGKHFAERVAEICVPEWKSIGIYTDAEAKAIDEFFQAFNDVSFPRGASVLFTTLSNGSLSISFSKDGSVPEVVNAVIKNKLMSEAVLASIIGKHGICYATKQSLAARLSELF